MFTFPVASDADMPNTFNQFQAVTGAALITEPCRALPRVIKAELVSAAATHRAGLMAAFYHFHPQRWRMRVASGRIAVYRVRYVHFHGFSLPQCSTGDVIWRAQSHPSRRA
ncbi:hypothetical protein RAG37_11510 [Klebsiella pneumoniae]